jgi:iron complex outermembrane receptor protein
MKNIKNVRLCGLGLTVLSVLLHPAVALPAPTEDAAQNGGAQSDAGLAEIVVTAQKREQSINDVPISITAISGDSLVKQGITSTADLAKIVPGFSYTYTNDATPVYTLRGVGLFDTGLASSPAVSVYVDQVPLPFPMMTAGASLDVERVEVLKE